MPTPSTAERELVLLAHRNQDVMVQVSEGLARRIGVLWDQVGGVTDEAQARFARAAADLVARTQRWAIADAESYIRTCVWRATRDPRSVAAARIDIDAVMATLREGVPGLDVYSRPSITARRALKDGRSFDEAMAIARDRATSTAETDLALASRAGAHQAMELQPRVAGYRRVPDAMACDYCLIASTQRYRSDQLMPLHGRCKCGVLPLVGETDPGRIIDRETHQRLKQSGAIDRQTAQAAARKLRKQATEARGRSASIRADLGTVDDPARRRRLERRADEWDRKADTYDARAAERSTRRRTEISVHEHGELGPVLTRKGDAFTGPDDIAG